MRGTERGRFAAALPLRSVRRVAALPLRSVRRVAALSLRSVRRVAALSLRSVRRFGAALPLALGSPRCGCGAPAHARFAALRLRRFVAALSLALGSPLRCGASLRRSRSRPAFRRALCALRRRKKGVFNYTRSSSERTRPGFCFSI